MPGSGNDQQPGMPIGLGDHVFAEIPGVRPFAGDQQDRARGDIGQIAQGPEADVWARLR